MTDESDIERALAIFQEFGPNRTIPIWKRWRNAFPDATDDEFEKWETQFREMEHFAYELGDQVMNGHLGSSEAAAIISKRYPLLGSESINHILSQACYFSRK
jgi:hypothetical protein